MLLGRLTSTFCHRSLGPFLLFAGARKPREVARRKGVQERSSPRWSPLSLGGKRWWQAQEGRKNGWHC